MKKRKPFKLQRTYNFKSESVFSTHTYYYESDAGQYKLTHDPKSDVIKIQMPNGEQIMDHLHSLMDRANLYELIDDGDFLVFLNQIQDEVDLDFLSADIKTSRFKINGIQYRLLMDTKEKCGVLNVSEQFIEFTEELLYVLNPEIPLLHQGKVETWLRTRLIANGFDSLPDTPYQLELHVTPKD